MWEKRIFDAIGRGPHNNNPRPRVVVLVEKNPDCLFCSLGGGKHVRLVPIFVWLLVLNGCFGWVRMEEPVKTSWHAIFQYGSPCRLSSALLLLEAM
jgi:hypothetical protein